MSGIISLLTMGYMQVGRRIGFANQRRLNLVGQIVITAAFALGLTLSSGSWLVFCLPVMFQIAVVFGNMAFWSLAGRMFNVQQGKRLFGIVGTGEWLAIVLMGFLTPVIAPLVGLSNLLWLAAMAMCVALIAMNVNMRRHVQPLVESIVPASAQERTAVAPNLLDIQRNPYVLALVGLSMAWWIGFFFIDNIFYYEAAQQLPTSEQLAGFLGVYLGVVGILALVNNLFVCRAGRPSFRSQMEPPGAAGRARGRSCRHGADRRPQRSGAGAVRCRGRHQDLGIGLGFSVDQSARSILFQPFPARCGPECRRWSTVWRSQSRPVQLACCCW